jgi:hypothetical protein
MNQFPRAVAREKLPQVPERYDAVGRRPRLGLQSKLCEQIVPFLAIGRHAVVYAVAVCLQQRQRILIELGNDLLCSAIEPEGPHLPIMFDGRRAPPGHLPVADQLRQPALHDPQRIEHLERAILGRRIAQPIHCPGIGVGEDMRGAAGVADEFDAVAIGPRLDVFCADRRRRRQHDQEQ